MRILAKFKKMLFVGFRDTLNFRKFASEGTLMYDSGLGELE